MYKIRQELGAKVNNLQYELCLNENMVPVLPVVI